MEKFKMFKSFEKKYIELKELMQNKLPRKLNLFNIRFRLALDIEIDFKGDVSLTKTKEVKDTYKLIIRLMELWNSYEAFIKYTIHSGYIPNVKVSKSKIFNQQFLEKANSLKNLKISLNKIRDIYKENSLFKVNFDDYLNKIKNDEDISNTIKNDCNKIKEYFKENKSMSGIEIISLIYAERNMYYHNGETAKMGMSYKNRQQLISTYIDILTQLIFSLAIYILDQEILKEKK